MSATSRPSFDGSFALAQDELALSLAFHPERSEGSIKTNYGAAAPHPSVGRVLPERQRMTASMAGSLTPRVLGDALDRLDGLLDIGA
jgi:hypothetical protein